MIIELFEGHAQEKIIERMFTNDEYKQLADMVTDEFVESMHQRVERCDTNATSVMIELQEYILLIKDLSAFHAMKTDDGLMESKLLDLQNNFVALLKESLSPGQFIYQETNGTVTVTVTVNNDDFSVQLEMDF